MDYHFYGWEHADVSAKDHTFKGIETPRDLYDALSGIWCADTCAPRMRQDWSMENKTLGQCSITAFLAQDIFGGKVYGILREGGNFHCYNVVDGCVFDLTSEQFGSEVLSYENNPEQFREVHFAKEEKRERYEHLKKMLLEKTNRKTILCYGDSNTYGYNPSNGLRYSEDVRWTGRLQKLLGNAYRVIEEGCNGRTTIFDDPIEGWKNGLEYLRPCLNSHKPVDIVILMLGSNDLKGMFHASAGQIAAGASALIEVIQSFTALKQEYVPRIILVSPPEIGEGIRTSPFGGSFHADAVSRSKEFPKYFKKTAEKYHCVFFNAAEYVQPSAIDSLHLSREAHEKLAEELCRTVRELETNESDERSRA